MKRNIEEIFDYIPDDGYYIYNNLIIEIIYKKINYKVTLKKLSKGILVCNDQTGREQMLSTKVIEIDEKYFFILIFKKERS